MALVKLIKKVGIGSTTAMTVAAASPFLGPIGGLTLAGSAGALDHFTNRNK